MSAKLNIWLDAEELEDAYLAVLSKEEFYRHESEGRGTAKTPHEKQLAKTRQQRLNSARCAMGAVIHAHFASGRMLAETVTPTGKDE